MKLILCSLLIFNVAMMTHAAEEPSVAETVPVEPTHVGCVGTLQDLVLFHEKEIVTVKEMMARWNEKIGVTIKKRQAVEQETKENLRKMEELKKQNTKESLKEADRQKKETSKSTKNLQAVDKEIKNQCRELMMEVRSMSRDTQQALKESCLRVIVNIQNPGY
jgi:hypothetical protein